MGQPVVVLAGQSNASRVSDEIVDELDALYGAGGYVLVRAYSAGAPLTRVRDDKSDWQPDDPLRDQMFADTVDALLRSPDNYLAGTIWLQGEADTFGSSNAQSYQQDFTALFEAFHEHLIDVFGQNEVGAEEARVIVANLSDAAPDASGRAHWDTVQDALSGLGASLDWVEMIDPDALALAHGFNPQDLFHDGLHYSDAFSLQLADALVGALGTAAASPPPNLLLGTAIRDEIQGTGASEIVQTFGGNDAVYAGKGADQIELGSGNDYVRVGGGEESFDGGSGHDYISYYDSRNGVRIDLRDNEVSGSWAVNDTINSFESASGSKTGDDEMHGTAGNNTLRSYGGDDILYGRGGSDKLYGGDGRDFLDGGAGQEVDYLFGGADADRFHFDRGEGVDIIKDFQNNIDRIELDNFDFSGGSAFDHAVQDGADVVFDFGQDGHLTVENATVGQLVNDLFLV